MPRDGRLFIGNKNHGCRFFATRVAKQDTYYPGGSAVQTRSNIQCYPTVRLDSVVNITGKEDIRIEASHSKDEKCDPETEVVLVYF